MTIWTGSHEMLLHLRWGLSLAGSILLRLALLARRSTASPFWCRRRAFTATATSARRRERLLTGYFPCKRKRQELAGQSRLGGPAPARQQRDGQHGYGGAADDHRRPTPKDTDTRRYLGPCDGNEESHEDRDEQKGPESEQERRQGER